MRNNDKITQSWLILIKTTPLMVNWTVLNANETLVLQKSEQRANGIQFNSFQPLTTCEQDPEV